MSKIKVLVAALFAMFAFGVVASSASAAGTPADWGLCELIGTKASLYTQEWCDEHSATKKGEYEFRLEGSSVLTVSEGKLDLEDNKATGGASKIECEGTDHGLVGPLDSDLLDFVLASKCTKISGLCNQGTVFATALHLPWKTLLLEEANGTFRDDIEEDPKAGVPGYVVLCGATIFELKVEDTCTGDTSTGILAVSTGVEATFDSLSPHANCSVGGTGSGVITGLDLILSPAGHHLSVGL
jgi:hypothetical protein